jgi:hypothetical protein
MSKEKEQVENPFENFNFLDAPTPASKKDEKEVASDELSPEEIEALEKAAKEQAKPSKDKSEKREEKKEDKEEEEEEPEMEPPVDEDSNPLNDYAKHMAARGLLDLDDEDVVESEEDLEKIQERTIQNGINSYKQSIPEDGQKFLEFLENGGRPEDFHKYYYSDSSFAEYSIDSEDNQKYVVEEALKLEGYSDEEIEDEINDAIDLGKLEKKAAVHLKKLQKIEAQNKDRLIEAQKEYAKQQEQLRAQNWDNFKKGLFDKEQIAGFKMSPKMKQEIWDYMAKPVNKKTGLTQYQIDSQENEDARYMFAYLLKNKWDIKALEKQVETKAVSKLRSKLNNYTDSRNKLGGAKSNLQKEDDGSNPFAGFKKLQ